VGTALGQGDRWQMTGARGWRDDQDRTRRSGKVDRRAYPGREGGWVGYRQVDVDDPNAFPGHGEQQ